MNGFAFGAAAVGVGVIAWAGLLTGGFVFLRFGKWFFKILGIEKVAVSVMIVCAAILCYITGMAILFAAGVGT